MFKVEALLVSKFHAAELLYAIFLKIAAKLHFFVQICKYMHIFCFHNTSNRLCGVVGGGKIQMVRGNEIAQWLI